MEKLTFDQLPEAVLTLTNKIDRIEQLLIEASPHPEPDHFLNINQVAELLDLARPTIYGLVARREIPHIKKGKRLYFQKSQIDIWLSEGRRKTIKEIAAEI